MSIAKIILVTSLFFTTHIVVAAPTIEQIAQTKITTYFVTAGLSGTYNSPQISPDFRCQLANEAAVGFYLLRGKTDAKIKNILSFMEVFEGQVSDLRDLIESDILNCNK